MRKAGVRRRSRPDAQRADRRRAPRLRPLGDASGAFGDLGTLLPYVLGAITVTGLPAAGLLLGYGVFLIGSGLFYGLPIAVQPMKVVGAVMLTSGLTPGEVAAAGIALGLVFLVLGASGAIGRLARLVPQSVTAGLQLGLGLSMAVLGLNLMADTPWLGILILATLLLLMRIPRAPAAPLALLLAVLLGHLLGALGPAPAMPRFDLALPAVALPAWSDWWPALELAVIPQIPLTITNALIVTAALARDLFPGADARVSERNLALSTGAANLALAPLGAMPMCHGAGGLQAQYRFGARTGVAPIVLGGLLLVLGLGLSGDAAALLGFIPMAAVGALLLVSGADLAVSRRLFDARPVCWPIIGATAALTLAINPAAGLVCGWLLEVLRRPVAQAFGGLPRRPQR